MRHVRSVGIASQLLESIAVSAASDLDVLHVARPLLGRIIATAVGRLSSPDSHLIASRVCTNSVYVQLYT